MKRINLLFFSMFAMSPAFVLAQTAAKEQVAIQSNAIYLHSHVDENIANLSSSTGVADTSLRDIFLAALSGHDRARKFVIERRLEYPQDDVRHTALFYLHGLIQDGDQQVKRLYLPILREAFNDESAKVRGLAVAKADEAIPWADKFWPKEQHEDAINELVDLVISKSLFERNRDDYHYALAVLQSEKFKPNHARLKSLQRALERLPKARQNDVEPIEVKWRKAVFNLRDSPKPAKEIIDDPFAQ